ncbi:MAG: FAD-dependent oxidoreductase, partial [Burkholderiales bacterium]
MLTVLSAYAATPPSRLDALTGLGMVGSYAFFGGWYPRGGSAAVPRALVEVLTEAGGRIEYGQRVDRID